MRNLSLNQLGEEAEDSDWLKGLTLNNDGRPPPCVQYATENRCDYGSSCKFSHHSGDISQFNVTKFLGLETVMRVADILGAGNTKARDKGGTGLGVPPVSRSRSVTPTPILKRLEPATRQQP